MIRFVDLGKLERQLALSDFDSIIEDLTEYVDGTAASFENELVAFSAIKKLKRLRELFAESTK